MLRFLPLALYIAFTYFHCFAAEEEASSSEDPFATSLVKTQNLLSTIVGSVSAISGEWIQSETDFVVLGPEPLILNRCALGNPTVDHLLGYQWDFNRPHPLIIDIQDKGTRHIRTRARLHHTSGIATVHESTVNGKKIDGMIIPLVLTRTQGLTNCRGEMSAKTNLHNTVVHVDIESDHCAATTGSGLLSYYEFDYQKDKSEWKEGWIGVGHYKKRLLNYYRLLYERKPNGNLFHYKKGVISATDASNQINYGYIQFNDEEDDLLHVETSDGKSGTYHFKMYNHPLRRSNGELGGFIKHRFSLTEAHFNHKPSERYEYTESPPRLLTEKPKIPLLKAKRKPKGRFQEVEYYVKGDNYLEMREEPKEEVRKIHLSHESDFRNHRVKVIKAPVGHDEKPVITHRFIYEVDPFYAPAKKSDSHFSGKTKVYDAYGRKTVYEYNKEHRPTAIQRFHRNNTLYSEECFTWDDRYSFPAEIPKKKNKQESPKKRSDQSDKKELFATTLSESIHSNREEKGNLSKKIKTEELMKMCLKTHSLQKGGAGNLIGKYLRDANGHVYYGQFFRYDKRGNIIRDRFYGNLTGTQRREVELNLHHQPIDNGCEYYEKRFVYSKDRLNLLRQEEEDNGKGILYSYHKGTDLVAAKYVTNEQFAQDNFFIMIRQQR